MPALTWWAAESPSNPALEVVDILKASGTRIRHVFHTSRLRVEMTVSQVLTLFTTPVIYLAFDRLGRRLRGVPLDTPLHPVRSDAGERPLP